MNNQKGMALLLSIIMLFILSSTLLHVLSVYESEKQFLELEKEWNTLDHLLLTSIKEVLLLNEDTERGNLVAGKLNYLNGSVHYQITSQGQQEVILFRAQTPSGKLRSVKLTYNFVTGEIINWIEGVNIQ